MHPRHIKLVRHFEVLVQALHSFSLVMELLDFHLAMSLPLELNTLLKDRFLILESLSLYAPFSIVSQFMLLDADDLTSSIYCRF